VPQSGQNDLLSAALFDRGNKVLVVPGIHRSTLDGDLIRKDSLDLRPNISAETLALHRAEDNRESENLCRFRECDGVVDDRLAVEIGNAKEHLRLVIDRAAIYGLDGVAWQCDVVSFAHLSGESLTCQTRWRSEVNSNCRYRFVNNKRSRRAS
jgi:hypothetical protein